jgi:curli biogenesis system outer membrane secretion channel CsgG
MHFNLKAPLRNLTKTYLKRNKMRFFYLIIVSLPLLFSSCKGPKYYTKLGTKQEAEGLSSEAANSYYNALSKKSNYIPAQAGLKRTGQLVLNQKLAEFGRKKSMATSREAVYSYLEATDYKDRIKKVGVELEVGQMYADDFEESKKDYIHELYEKGTSHLEKEEYKEAESKFKEIEKFDPNFKDAKELQDIAYLEPLYKDGKLMFEAGKYRTAYESLEKVINRKSTYKDARELRQKSLDKGTITIALLPFSNGTKTSGIESNMSAYTLSALAEIKDPFLKVVDRENMMAIMQEQKLQLSGFVDENTAVEVGKLVGAQYILTGTILKFDEKKGNVNNENRTAYLSYLEKQVSNGQEITVTKYKPISYYDHYGKSSSSIDFQLKVVSLKTGELLKTKMINKRIEDEVHYAKADVPKDNLFPGSDGRVETANDRVQSFRSLFNARRELKSTSDLSSDAYNQISKEIASDVKSLMLELVK